MATGGNIAEQDRGRIADVNKSPQAIIGTSVVHLETAVPVETRRQGNKKGRKRSPLSLAEREGLLGAFAPRPPGRRLSATVRRVPRRSNPLD